MNAVALGEDLPEGAFPFEDDVAVDVLAVLAVALPAAPGPSVAASVTATAAAVLTVRLIVTTLAVFPVRRAG